MYFLHIDCRFFSCWNIYQMRCCLISGGWYHCKWEWCILRIECAEEVLTLNHLKILRITLPKKANLWGAECLGISEFKSRQVAGINPLVCWWVVFSLLDTYLLICRINEGFLNKSGSIELEFKLWGAKSFNIKSVYLRIVSLKIALPLDTEIPCWKLFTRLQCESFIERGRLKVNNGIKLCVIMSIVGANSCVLHNVMVMTVLV